MTDQHQPDDPAEAPAPSMADLEHLAEWGVPLAGPDGRVAGYLGPTDGLLDRARARTLGPSEATDPRRALIRTDPGRHAANRGPAYASPELVEARARFAAADARLPVFLTDDAELDDRNAWPRPAGQLLHRCPEPEPSREGWWFAVGLGCGVLLTALAWLLAGAW